MRNNAHLLKHLQASIEQRSAENDFRFSTVSSGEAEHDTLDDKNENQNENGSPDEDINERHFYTACMTNPPFYDEDEKV
jgi:23S rRNA A1618 N6-methylase RlmF